MKRQTQPLPVQQMVQSPKWFFVVVCLFLIFIYLEVSASGEGIEREGERI